MPKSALLSFVKRHKCELLCFVLPMAAEAVLGLLRGYFIRLEPDAQLYYSIAENFRATGHFIQTARDAELMVVPFGVPLILTILRMIGFTLPAIIAFQYLMLGTACLLLYKTERILFGKGGFAPLFYYIALLRAHVGTSGIFVEHYFLLLMIVLLYLSVRTDMADRKRLTLMNLTGMYMTACRPVLIPIYAAVIVYTLALVFRRRITVGRLAVLLLIPALVFGANTLVNYRETGYPVVMDTYSGKDLYMANNPDAGDYFSEEEYAVCGDDLPEIQEDPGLNRLEKNKILRNAAIRWILDNFGTFQLRTIWRFAESFIWLWRYALIPCFLGAMHGIAAGKKWRRWTVLTLVLNLIVAVITSMGIIEARYTIVVWPLASLHLAAISYPTLDWLKSVFSLQAYQKTDSRRET